MGIQSLLAGILHPAAYVLLGNAVNIKNIFKSFHFDSEINIKPIEIYNQTTQYFTMENAENTLRHIGKQFMHIDLGDISSSIKSSFFDHAVEWQSAAVWGATTTIAHMVLKKIPVIKHHEYLRLSLATAIGTLGTIAGYEYALEQNLPLDHFFDIAYKVALLGIPLQVLNRVSQGGLKFTHASAERIATVVKGSCAFGLATLKFFEWKGPEKIRPEKKNTSVLEVQMGRPKPGFTAPLRRAATLPARTTEIPRSPSPEPTATPTPPSSSSTESDSSDSE